jgi:hypothetical protein
MIDLDSNENIPMPHHADWSFQSEMSRCLTQIVQIPFDSSTIEQGPPSSERGRPKIDVLCYPRGDNTTLVFE